MRIALPLFVGLVVSSAVICPDARAVSGTASQRIFFNDQGQIIGESLRYCDATQSHWGVALRESTDYVDALYGCGVQESIHITYGASTPASVRSSVCSMPRVALCTQTLPWPSYAYVTGPITQSLYSD